ncbi:MAG: AAA family ATPase [Atribacterota bacterium]
MTVQVKKVNKLLQPRIMAVVGGMGTGKTLFISAIAEKLKNTYLIMANYKLQCREKNITPENISELLTEAGEETSTKKKLMVIDEFHIFSDSRLSSSHHNILMSYFVTQTRKQDIQLIYTTQQFGQVDIRIRDNTDILAMPAYNPLKDEMKVIFLKKDWLTSQFIFSHYKIFKNLKPVFDVFSTEQILGEKMIERIKEKEKQKMKKS